jgi:hypothetical protein
VRTLKWIGLLLVLLLRPATSWAQAHPCDTFGTQPPVPLGAVTMDMCWSEKDSVGQPVTAKGFAIIIDNGTPTPIAMTKTTPTASAQGLYLFQGPYTLTTPGTHTVIFEVTIDNGSGGNLATQSSPLTLQVSAPVHPPAAPAKTRVSPSPSR